MSTSFGSKDIEIRKVEFVTKTQCLCLCVKIKLEKLKDQKFVAVSFDLFFSLAHNGLSSLS